MTKLRPNTVHQASSPTLWIGSALTLRDKLWVDDVEAGLEWFDHMETAVSSTTNQKIKRI